MLAHTSLSITLYDGQRRMRGKGGGLFGGREREERWKIEKERHGQLC